MGFTLIQLIKHRMSRERMERRRDMEQRKEKKTPPRAARGVGSAYKYGGIMVRRKAVSAGTYALLAKIVRDLGEDVIRASSMVRGG